MIDLFYFDGGLKKENISLLEKKGISGLSGFVWVDVTDITKDEVALLENIFDLHPLTSEDLFNSNTRIKVEEFNNYMFCVFYGILKNPDIELVEMDFVVGKNFLITHHRKDLNSVSDLKKNDDVLGKLFLKGPDFLFHRLLDMEIDNYFPVIEAIDDDIEDIEASVTSKALPIHLSQILKMKREIVYVRKFAFNQREKISYIAKNELPFVSKKAVPYFRDVYDHAIRVSDALDNNREAVSSTFEAYMSSVSNDMNEVMKVLSIIATIALPLTVISGIYGTNFESLPGSSYVYGFWTMIFFMLLMVASMLLFFRKRRWI